MTPAPAAPLTVVVNFGAQRQVIQLIHARPVARLSAVLGVCQGDRCWITDVQDDAPDWARDAHSELDIKRSAAWRHWYDGYRAGLRFARLQQLGWWWHGAAAPPQDAGEVLQRPELTGLLTRPELYAVSSRQADPSGVLLLLTWLYEGELRCRVLEVDPVTQGARDLSVLL